MTNDKIALVTGANKGIGREIARQLGGLGYTVVVGSRDLARGEAATKELVAEGIKAEVVELEVTDERSVRAAARTMERNCGSIAEVVRTRPITLVS